MTSKGRDMENMENHPRLRVAPVPVEIEGKQMLMFQDPERLTEETVLLPIEAAAIIQFFDGARSVRQIQEELMRQSGQLIDSSLIQDLADQLDEHLLLDSPRLLKHLHELNESWRRESVRPAYHAGSAYPADRRELINFLDQFYAATDGPGPLPEKPAANDLKGIVAPHMSIQDSGICTAHAFKLLAERTEARLFVILGTGHMEGQRVFVLSDKDYETPLGVARTDRELANRIVRLRRNRNPLDDYVHKQEHSIEFITVFLQHALKNREFRILPVLCAGTSPSVAVGEPLANEPAWRDFMAALEAALAERGEPVCFIAGADLAHLGPRYGDRETYAPIRIPEEEAADRAMLAHLDKADADGFFLQVAGEKDRRRVCGLGPIYALAKAAKPTRGELLKWACWHDQTTHSVVSFCSMAFY